VILAEASEAEIAAHERLAAAIPEADDGIRRGTLPISQRVVRRHAPRTPESLNTLATSFRSLWGYHVARLLKATPRAAHREILERIAARHPMAEARDIATALLDLDDEELRLVTLLIGRRLDCTAFEQRHVRRQDTGPPSPRHVATPIIANAPPARLPTAPEYAERRAA
jgi:hypothetical protein